MQYKIVTAGGLGGQHSLYELKEKVTEEISFGWKPIGGPSMSEGIAFRAMIKEER